MSIRPSQVALDLARELVSRDAAGTLSPAESGAALERTLARVSENLRRSLGDDGYAALFSRAVAQNRAAHPALDGIRGEGSGALPLDGLGARMGTHDIHVVSAAFEAVLASIVDVLSGLIGADMVLNLLDPDGISSASPRGRESQ